ncbi:MAG TPA: hypothetical protein VNX46_02650, partial [Candidatus Acidoferrum sp.]|nr:hypothetical protein [Candidatus Acidoferrum sp.]
DDPAGEIILKVINPGGTSLTGNIRLAATEVAAVAKMAVLGGENGDVNSMDTPKKIVPVESRLEGVSSNFSHDFPPCSITVLRFNVKQ